jgi:hypothetical protein
LSGVFSSSLISFLKAFRDWARFFAIPGSFGPPQMSTTIRIMIGQSRSRVPIMAGTHFHLNDSQLTY